MSTPKNILESLGKKQDLLVALNCTVANVRSNKMTGEGPSDHVVNVTLNDGATITQFSNQRYAKTLAKLREGDVITFAFKKQNTRTVPAEKVQSGVPYDVTEFKDITLLDIQLGEAPETFEALKDREEIAPVVSRSAAGRTVAPRRADDAPVTGEESARPTAFDDE